MLLGSVSITLNSCSERQEIIENANENLITNFKKQVVSSTGKNSSNVVFSDMRSTDEFLNSKIDGLIVEFDLENRKAYFTNEFEDGKISFDLQKDSNDVFRLENAVTTLPQNSNGREKLPSWLCGASCVAQGFGISLWDGPAPFMDVAAAAYTYVCAKDC
ncbi:hypothetical protein CO230_11390 [Chryseobacterium sp. 6424]|uniref:hypothetical protein n=1 Tax=Chryseobacterium sp. 6424 TaxID=2039166 RepID=UPI000EFB0919|nr:hypothetical protein [Chryseobacterium sp. 6424]AYO58666.1 hypothetical protein CO230_11390 [Chryseobacterium sp. 6424]